MDLKAQWLWVAVLPILIILITGKYIGKFKGGGIEFEQFTTEPEMRLLQYVSPPPLGVVDAHPLRQERAGSETPELKAERLAEVKRTERLFLLHVYEPSTRPNQKYDITIFLIRHVQGQQPNQREGFSEVDKLELYLGRSWNNDSVITALNTGGLIGIRTSAWGTFLATGRVIFKDGRPPVILHRYIDFEMAPKKI